MDSMTGDLLLTNILDLFHITADNRFSENTASFSRNFLFTYVKAY